MSFTNGELVDLLASVCKKAWGEKMNSPWSAWANDKLTQEERDALAAVGVEVDTSVSNVVISVEKSDCGCGKGDECQFDDYAR